jgi:hypothetical protein
MKIRCHICISVFLIIIAANIEFVTGTGLDAQENPTDYLVIFDASQSMADKIKEGKDFLGKTKLEVAKERPYEIFFENREITDNDTIALIIVDNLDPQIEVLTADTGYMKKMELKGKIEQITEESLGYPSNLSKALRLAADYFYYQTDPDNYHWLIIISDGKQSPIDDDICTTAKRINIVYGTKLEISSYIWFGIAMGEEELQQLTCVNAFLPQGVLLQISELTNYTALDQWEKASREIERLRNEISALQTENENLRNEEKMQIEPLIRAISNHYENKSEEKKALYAKLEPLIPILAILLMIGMIMLIFALRIFLR